MSSIFSLNSYSATELITIGIFFIVVFIYQITKRDKRIEKHFKNFNGPPSLPIFGVVFWFLRPNHKLVALLNGWCERYGPVFKVWLINMPFVGLSRASEIEVILSSTVHIEKSKDYELLHNWLGLGLLTAKPQKWHGRRKLLTPAFHFKILEEFAGVFNEQANIFTKILKKDCSHGRPFDVFPYVTRCALDIICAGCFPYDHYTETAMGKQLNAQFEHDIGYVKAVYGYGDILVRKFLRPWLKIDFIWKITGNEKMENEYLKTLHDFTEQVITERKRERKQNKNKSEEIIKEDEYFKKRKAFLDLLLDVAETDSSLTDYEVRNEVDTFMFEGHDTTAANMAWTILTLSAHPEHQKRVQEELDGIFGSDKGRDITTADVAKMKYLESCIKESLRLYPSVPFFFRNLTEDAELGSGKQIPKGTSVLISAYSLHRDPNVFPSPEDFLPDRFFAENSIGRSPFAYVPFSAGPRNCIGQKFALLEEKIVLAKLFLNFNIQSVKKREDVRMLPDIILRPMDGIEVKITPRD